MYRAYHKFQLRKHRDTARPMMSYEQEVMQGVQTTRDAVDSLRDQVMELQQQLKELATMASAAPGGPPPLTLRRGVSTFSNR